MSYESLVWALLHAHPGVPLPMEKKPNPQPWREELLAGLAIHDLASSIRDGAARQQIQEAAVKQMSKAISSFPSDEPKSPVTPRTDSAQ